MCVKHMSGWRQWVSSFTMPHEMIGEIFELATMTVVLSFGHKQLWRFVGFW